MRLFARPGRSAPTDVGTAGTVRVDSRTKNLTKRLRPGDVAVIDHIDIDRVSAEALVACRPAAVLNAAVSSLTVVPVIGPLFAIPLVVRRDVKETPGGKAN